MPSTTKFSIVTHPVTSARLLSVSSAASGKTTTGTGPCSTDARATKWPRLNQFSHLKEKNAPKLRSENRWIKDWTIGTWRRKRQRPSSMYLKEFRALCPSENCYRHESNSVRPSIQKGTHTEYVNDLILRMIPFTVLKVFFRKLKSLLRTSKI